MSRFLSLSQAARLVGATRGTIQSHIRQGRLSTFEGQVELGELLKVYPDVSAEDSVMLERLDRIKAQAPFKYTQGNYPDAADMASEIQRLRVALGDARVELDAYRGITAELKARLEGLQEDCDHRQKVLLGTVITWLMHKLDQRR